MSVAMLVLRGARGEIFVASCGRRQAAGGSAAGGERSSPRFIPKTL